MRLRLWVRLPLWIQLPFTNWTPDIERQAKAAGANACLPKPLEVETVLSLLGLMALRA